MTVAYSNKYNAWTTRYSFKPTCYAKVDNSFVSFRNGAWEHDVNNSRCKFYDQQESSKLEVVANQDPSAVKMFKAISLETNENDWKAEVFTNDDYSGNEKQQGEVGAFISKEGYKYAEIPRSTLNSSSNIFPYVGAVSDVTVGLNVTDLAIIFTSLNASEDYNGFQIGLVGLDASFNIPVSTEGRVRIYKSEEGVLVDPEIGEVSVSMYLHSLYQSNLFVVIADFSQASGFDISNGQDVNDIITNALSPGPLFFESPASVNGDTMRGPYLRASIETTTEEPLELHAVNVDYEFSKLDARLTQNT
tara:strand:- start:1911 stop:2822 length:912 start_codon:yes stop_codon:yes gene_type:complete